MSRVEISAAADQDIVDIYEYTFLAHSEQQADRYVRGLQDAFSRLASSPGMAGSAEWLRPGYRRFE